MPTVVGVTLRNAPSAVLIDPADVELKLDDVAVVETERGTELGRVSEPPREREARDSVDASFTIVRAATSEDLAHAAELHTRERAAMPSKMTAQRMKAKAQWKGCASERRPAAR